MFSAISIVKMNAISFIFILFCFVRHLHSSTITAQKIINGENTNIKSVPFMLSMRISGHHFCGACILNEQWAVTAAHCVTVIKDYPEEVTLCSGSSSLNQCYVVHNVSEFIIHEKYNNFISDYDIALIKVKDPFIYDDYTKAVVLPSDRHICSNWGIICGWGYYQKFNDVEPNLSYDLKCGKVPRVSRSRCELYLWPYKVTNRMICYGFPRGGVDTCQGDSGGPIVNSDNILLGITSWGNDCANKFSPGVYTNVRELQDWITNEIEKDSLRNLLS